MYNKFAHRISHVNVGESLLLLLIYAPTFQQYDILYNTNCFSCLIILYFFLIFFYLVGESPEAFTASTMT